MKRTVWIVLLILFALFFGNYLLSQKSAQIPEADKQTNQTEQKETGTSACKDTDVCENGVVCPEGMVCRGTCCVFKD